MSNEFYTPSTTPVTLSRRSIATIRAEFAAIARGLNKLPVMNGNAGRFVAVNSTGTALEAVSSSSILQGAGALPLSGGVMTGDLIMDATDTGGVQIRRASDDVVQGRVGRNTNAIFLTSLGEAVPLQLGSQGTPRLIIAPSGAVGWVPMAGAPASPVEGQTYYDSTLKALRVWDGTEWRTLTAAGGSVSLGPLALSEVTASSITPASATVSVQISGTIPAGSRALLQVTANQASGPWLESSRPTATAGTFSFSFSSLSAATTYYARAFVFQDNGGTGDVIHAQTATTPFMTASSVATELVLPIGDSITNGDTSATPVFYSWRGAFQSLMTAAGRSHQMLGPNNTGLGSGPDPDSAAWGGASIDGAAGNTNNITGRLNTIFTVGIQPTTIVLFIGWNEMWDIAQGGSASTAAARWLTLYNEIRTRRPSARIVVCTLHRPSDGTRRDGQNSLNAQIRSTAAANAATTALVDLDILDLAPGDYADYVHLSEAGAQRVAQAIYNVVAGTVVGVGSVVDDMVAQMGLNPPGAAPTLLQPGTGWDTGGRVCIGGDVRGVAKPFWWRYNQQGQPILPAATEALINNYPWWDFLYPWYEVWDIDGHVAGLNARVVVDWIEGWVRYDDVVGWQRFGRSEGAQLYAANDDAGAFYERGSTGTAFGTKDLINGALHLSVAPYGRMFHGWGAAAQCRGQHIIALQTRCRVRLALANPAGAQDLAQARYAAHVGCDPFPPGPAGLGMQPYNPGNGVSRWEIVTQTPKILYWSTIDVPACQSVDESYPYNFRQTVTEAEFRANPPPLP